MPKQGTEKKKTQKRRKVVGHKAEMTKCAERKVRHVAKRNGPKAAKVMKEIVQRRMLEKTYKAGYDLRFPKEKEVA
jgi:hypothetical protein